MKNSIFWDIMPCSLMKASVSEEHITSHPHGQSKKPAWSREQAWLTPWPWWWWYLLPKHQLTFTGLHIFIYQKVELFVVTAVRTSNTLKHHANKFSNATPSIFSSLVISKGRNYRKFPRITYMLWINNSI